MKGVRDGKSVRDKGLGLVLGLFAINSDLECLLQIQTYSRVFALFTYAGEDEVCQAESLQRS